jgi:hypothetical protein
MKPLNASIFLMLFGVLILFREGNAQNLVKDKPYKFGDFMIVSPDTMKMDYIIKGEPPKKRISAGDTLYEDDKYLILGNADVLHRYDEYGIFKKFKLQYDFKMFEVPVYKGKLAPPNFKTDKAAWLYRTQIREQCKNNGINFAGHYTLCKWGCGSECLDFAIVNRIDGRINYSNIAIKQDDVFYTLLYKANSKLILLNDWKLQAPKGYISCYKDDYKLIAVEWINNKIKKLSK